MSVWDREDVGYGGIPVVASPWVEPGKTYILGFDPVADFKRTILGEFRNAPRRCVVGSPGCRCLEEDQIEKARKAKQKRDDVIAYWTARRAEIDAELGFAIAEVDILLTQLGEAEEAVAIAEGVRDQIDATLEVLTS